MTTRPVARDPRARAPRSFGLLALALATGLMAGCSATEQPPSAQEESSAAAEESEAAAGPYLPVADGTELTGQGEQLKLGDTATVAYQPPKKKPGVLELTVTKIERAKIKDLVAFKLDKQAQKATPFYVRAKLRNVGDTNLSGTLPPLYVEDGRGRLVQASQFRSTYKPCPSTGLPAGFKNGKTANLCWVYLVTGKAQTVSFYPIQGFIPIAWSGEITSTGNQEGNQSGNKNGNQNG